MDSGGDGVTMIHGQPFNKFRKRLSENNLPPLDINAANRTASTRLTIPQHCMYASPECRTIRGGRECTCDEDVKQEGKDLFCNFVREEIIRRGLEERLSPLIVE